MNRTQHKNEIVVLEVLEEKGIIFQDQDPALYLLPARALAEEGGKKTKPQRTHD